MTNKLRLAWFSANLAENSFSKGAYATDTLLPLLKQNFEIDLFCEKAGSHIGGLVSKNFLTANIINKKNPYDFYIYNFENKKFADFIRIHLGLMPGVCWFHDFNLLDDGPEPILNSPWSRMTELFHNPLNQSFKWPAFKDLYIPSRPAAVRESGISFFNLFSNERDLAQFRSVTGLKLNSADQGSLLPLPAGRNYFTEIQNLTEVSVALCCAPSVDSHIHNVLFALKDIKASKLNWMLEYSEREKAQELIREFDLKNVNLHFGKSPERWSQILKESKFAVHFLYSFYEQLQPWLSLSMAHGKECLVLDFGESEYLPDNVVFKISCGKYESQQVRSVLTNRLLLQGTGSQAAQLFAAEKHMAEDIAAQLYLYLRKIQPAYQQLLSRWNDLQQIAKNKLVQQGLPQMDDKNLEYFRQIYSEIGWL